MRSPAYCPACGSTPVAHRALWLASTGDVIALRIPFESLPLYRFLLGLGNWVAGVLGRVAVMLGRLLRIITLSTDLDLSVSKRSRLLWLEARRRDIPMEHLLFFGNPTDTFRVKGSRGYSFFKSLPLPPPGDALRMDDKVLFKRTLRDAGLPVPQSRSVSDVREAEQALQEFSLVCVKPRTGSNGRHTYPYVHTREDLREALRSVKQICAFASVEEHLEGSLCRATCVDGVLVGFLESKYPTVSGDGTSTIRERIAHMNRTRAEGVGEIVVDEHHEGYLARRGYTLDSVLPEGESVPLTYRAGASAGGSNREHGRAIHPSFIEPIERAARATGLSIVGFDIIIPDPHAPAEEQRWGFIEANSLPWIDLHARPFSGAPIDLSAFVWDLWSRSGVR